eukprot:351853-Chlamydomonas_euryale.AAC.8
MAACRKAPSHTAASTSRVHATASALPPPACSARTAASFSAFRCSTTLAWRRVASRSHAYALVRG